MNKFNLGIEVKDVVTGFKGIVMAHAEYLTGCDQYLVLPQPKKGSNIYPESRWFDEGRIKSTKRGIVIKSEDVAEEGNPGCDMLLPNKK